MELTSPSKDVVKNTMLALVRLTQAEELQADPRMNPDTRFTPCPSVPAVKRATVTAIQRFLQDVPNDPHAGTFRQVLATMQEQLRGDGKAEPATLAREKSRKKGKTNSKKNRKKKSTKKKKAAKKDEL